MYKINVSLLQITQNDIIKITGVLASVIIPITLLFTVLEFTNNPFSTTSSIILLFLILSLLVLIFIFLKIKKWL